jgi:alkanesulfonate monooxygenase SsuD/methylene tetrahydromethanopterin reductase-like flavin-dependent oxidoreductase (luciferase family)
VTHRVRCACLVYDIAMRPLGVLAQAIATIDHLSGGRAVLGVGTGYLQREHDAFGIPLGSPRERSDRLQHGVEALVALLHDRVPVTVNEPLLQLDNARCEPGPLQEHLPLWIGGGGERRTIPLAARLADGWNIPMATADDTATKIGILRRATVQAGRPVNAVEATVNVGLSFDADLIPERYGPRWPVLRPAILSGSRHEVIDQVHRYVDAGVDWLVLSLRTPFDADELDRFATEIAPEFA